MKKSIFFFITALYLFSVLIVGVFFYFTQTFYKNYFLYEKEKRFDFISKLISQKPQILISKEILEFDLEPIKHPKYIEKIIKTSTIIKKIKIDGGEINFLTNNFETFIIINIIGNIYCFKDTYLVPKKEKIFILLFFVTFLSITFLYIVILLKLKPLKEISKVLHSFTKGDFKTYLKPKGKDEISQVIKALNLAAKNIEKEIKTKELFIRNLMHEIKTPVAKGRILSEMIDSKHKDSLVYIFERLNSLLEESVALENLNAKKPPKKMKVPISSLVEDAISMGMFEREKIKIIQKSNFYLYANPNLIAIALKNLIQNALEKSPTVEIIIKNNTVFVLNEAPPLKKELNFYLAPFVKEKSKGFGLGLYITKTIADFYGFGLNYLHEKNKNIFSLSFS